MTAVPLNIVIEQGATWRFDFVYYQPAVDVDGNAILDADGNFTPGDPYDLTGCEMRMQVRKGPTNETVTLQASTDADDGITLGGVTGAVSIRITDEKSEALGAFANPRDERYDIKLYWPSGEEDRLYQGAAQITPAITRDPAP